MLKDISGQHFGNLTVIKRDTSYISNKHTKWICQCNCGNTKSIFRNALINGSTKSCGCQQFKGKPGINQTHGMSKTRIYHEWLSMRRRCAKNSPDAYLYFNRGITVCNEWQNNFMLFYQWSMENGYNDDLSIDRIDNNRGYCPDNCRWISMSDQQSNKRNNVKVQYNGKEYCLRQLCKKINFPYKTAHRRYQRMKAKNQSINIEKLFAPIQTEKIPFRYRK